MDTGREATQPSTADIVDQMSGWAVGGGIVTIALFPLALPILALTVVAVIPFLLVPLAAGLIAAVLAAPILLVRSLRRSLKRRKRPQSGFRAGSAGSPPASA
jgi:membrane protein implicated in regulation of membrane protease activity